MGHIHHFLLKNLLEFFLKLLLRKLYITFINMLLILRIVCSCVLKLKNTTTVTESCTVTDLRLDLPIDLVNFRPPEILHDMTVSDFKQFFCTVLDYQPRQKLVADPNAEAAVWVNAVQWFIGWGHIRETVAGKGQKARTSPEYAKFRGETQKLRGQTQKDSQKKIRNRR